MANMLKQYLWLLVQIKKKSVIFFIFTNRDNKNAGLWGELNLRKFQLNTWGQCHTDEELGKHALNDIFQQKKVFVIILKINERKLKNCLFLCVNTLLCYDTINTYYNILSPMTKKNA